MKEQPRNVEHLLKPTPEELEREREMGMKGFIPERWLEIERIEMRRMQAGMEEALRKRLDEMEEGAIEQRQATVQRYFRDLMLDPSFKGGPYAAAQWLNLHEMFRRIIDKRQDENIIPSADERISFKSFALDKDAIIDLWLVEKIQAALSEAEKLTEYQIKDCFTNVSEQQLNVVIDQIAKSGLTLKPESPKEFWRRMSKKESNQ